jgi:beta-mannanase
MKNTLKSFITWCIENDRIEFTDDYSGMVDVNTTEDAGFKIIDEYLSTTSETEEQKGMSEKQMEVQFGKVMKAFPEYSTDKHLKIWLFIKDNFLSHHTPKRTEQPMMSAEEWKHIPNNESSMMIISDSDKIIAKRVSWEDAKTIIDAHNEVLSQQSKRTEQ